MNTLKNVKYLIPAQNVDMAGIPIKQALPTQKIAQVDPFLLLHHAKSKTTDTASAKHQGIDPHPHRGFSPVTFIISGEVHHRDSWGNNQIAKKGEIQWMHAGAGIVHSERPSKEMCLRNEEQEIVQLWINTPAQHKMIPPNYQYLSTSEIPKFYSSKKGIESKLVAGKYNDLRSKVITQSEQLIIWGNSKVKDQAVYNVTNSWNCMLYLIKGNIKVKGYGMVEAEHLIIFESEGENIQIEADPNAQWLLLAGNPINEKVVQQGPYVMNTETQILEAMRDYQMGKMGILIED